MQKKTITLISKVSREPLITTHFNPHKHFVNIVIIYTVAIIIGLCAIQSQFSFSNAIKIKCEINVKQQKKMIRKEKEKKITDMNSPLTLGRGICIQ